VILVASVVLIATLATWLGATVIARAPRYYVARVFALTMALTACWSIAQLIARLTASESVRFTMSRAEVFLAELAPAVVLHFVLAFLHGRRAPAGRAALLALAYGAGLAVGVAAIAAPERPISPTADGRLFGPTAGAVVGWGWIALRALVLGLACRWIWRAWRRAERGGERRRQIRPVFGAVGAAAAGIVLLILSYQVGALEWVGMAVLVGSLGLAGYAVFIGGIFVAPATARRSFWLSVATGVLTAAYIGLLLGLDRLARTILGTDAPIVTTLALVLTIALFDPVRDRLRLVLDRLAGRRDLPYRRLLRAFGDELLIAQRPDEAIAPALAHLCHAVGIRGAAILDRAGDPIARYGAAPDPLDDAVTIPLVSNGEPYGRAVFGPKRARLPYTRADRELLDHAASFIAAALGLAERHEAQAATLDALARERAAFGAREAALAEALSALAAPGEPEPAPAPGLRVYALGPLRAERDGAPIRQWGGAKAGSRQAEAIFAFLFDRGERGVAKDEFLELIWPDVPLDKADLAFHRTLGGLRRVLDPGHGRGGEGTAVAFHNDRYRLDPAVVAWSDVAEFEARLAALGNLSDPAATLATLEEARALYRGDYLDDCPYYGDSEFVEARRAILRGRYVDLLVALGEGQEARGNAPAAAVCYREALRATGDDCPRASAALSRLGLPAA
jgi:hypothetical protein